MTDLCLSLGLFSNAYAFRKLLARVKRRKSLMEKFPTHVYDATNMPKEQRPQLIPSSVRKTRLVRKARSLSEQQCHHRVSETVQSVLWPSKTEAYDS